jgi:small subunit ribosomal protein S13
MTKLIRAKIMSSSMGTKTLYNLIMSFPGIGFYKTKKILMKLGFPIHTLKQKVKDLSESYKEKLYKLVMEEVEVSKKNAKPKHKLLTIKTYKNYRFLYNLPLRGQRTKTNAQTRKKLKKRNDTIK